MLPLRRNEWLSYNSTLSEYDLVGYWTLGLCPRNPRNSKFRLRNDVNVTEVKKKSDGDRSYLGGQRAACAANRTRVEARLNRCAKRFASTGQHRRPPGFAARNKSVRV